MQNFVLTAGAPGRIRSVVIPPIESLKLLARHDCNV